jgi:hypothetical protein
MGWTYTDLGRNRLTLEQAKSMHVMEATRYGSNICARIVMHEWKPKTWYAVIRMEYLEGHEKAGQIVYFLRTDMIDITGGQFGYKDMTEDMGPYLDDKPSRAMAKAVYKYIPHAAGYAKDFRDWACISYQNENQIQLI